jgi:cyanophycinase
MRIKSAIAAMLVSAATCFAQGYVCAEGGGTGSGAWAAEMYGWMAEKGGKGAVVLLGAVELDAADKPDSREAAFVKAGASSAKSLVITEKNADTQEVYDAITAASIVFIRGGSQSRYVEMWKGTKTEAAIRAVFAKGGVVGGTSAGCAILGDVSYDAIHGSLKPEEVVKDGRHPDLTLTRGFLGLVPGVLFDTHFGERARLPRLAVMLAHCQQDHQLFPVGIGLDPKTALCVSPDGTAEVRGEGYATFLQCAGPAMTQVRLGSGAAPLVSTMTMATATAGTKVKLGTGWLQVRTASGGKRTPVTSPEMTIAGSVKQKDPAQCERAHIVTDELKTRDLLEVITDPYVKPTATMAHVTRHLMEDPSRIIVLASAGCIVGLKGSSLTVREEAGPHSSCVVINSLQVSDSPQPDWWVPGMPRANLSVLPPGSVLNTHTGVVTAGMPLQAPAVPVKATPPAPAGEKPDR